MEGSESLDSFESDNIDEKILYDVIYRINLIHIDNILSGDYMLDVDRQQLMWEFGEKCWRPEGQTFHSTTLEKLIVDGYLIEMEMEVFRLTRKSLDFLRSIRKTRL